MALDDVIPMWHTIERVEMSDTGEWRTEVHLPEDSSWFMGHFPGDPILPGIAQIGMASETVLRALGEGFRIAGFSRIKFKKIIRPGEHLKICVSPKTNPAGLYPFRILVGDEIACSGAMALERRCAPETPGRD
jgi:3-hydroxymyristoyl/3-hydroxydecanoyl-(acyl carrier protein) dehydratase